METLLTQHNIAPEIAERIRELSNEALEENNILTSATLYTTAPNTARGYTTSYYTYQGHKMRSDVLSVTGKSPGWSTIQKGSQTKTVANSITNMTLATAGLASVTLSIVGAGKSVLDLFTDYYNNAVITGRASDFLQINIAYSTDLKWVYGDYSNANDWRLGLTTQRVKIRDFYIYLHLYANNKGEDFMRTISPPSSSWYSAASYNNPWAKAWTYIHSPATENITWQLYNKTVMF